MNTNTELSKHKKRILDQIFKNNNQNKTYKNIVAEYYKDFKNDEREEKTIENFERYVTSQFLANSSLSKDQLFQIMDLFSINDLQVFLFNNECKTDLESFNYLDDVFEIASYYDTYFKDVLENTFFNYIMNQLRQVIYNRYETSFKIYV